MTAFTDYYGDIRRTWVRREQEEQELRRVYQDDYLHRQWLLAVEFLRKYSKRGWTLDRMLLARRSA